MLLRGLGSLMCRADYLVRAVLAILKECKAYAQAVGQQAKDIDGKVCAEKTVGKTQQHKDTSTERPLELRRPHGNDEQRPGSSRCSHH